jgi:hypothetical protein
MKAMAFIVSFMAAAASLVNALPAVDDSPIIDKSSRFYEAHINKYISRCQAKAVLIQYVPFENSQRIMYLAKKKAAFLAENKVQLVSEMIEKNFGEKHYLVEFYLNKRFQETTQSDDIESSPAIEMLGI